MENVPHSDAFGHFPPWAGRAIVLLDLDAFFASVEQLDHPEWRGKPVIVGGSPTRGGVVSTCSYEARAFGVRSAMPASQAARLCPQAVWAPHRLDRYRELSAQVMAIIERETPYVERVSIDEAFADITPSRVNTEHPIVVAQRIQQRVYEEVGVTCSIGLGTSKAVAKIASNKDKPHGITVVFPGTELQFLEPLAVGELSGVGKRAQEMLRDARVRTLGDLLRAPDDVLSRVFGVRADEMRARAAGKGDSAIVTERSVKSVSNEVTFADVLCSRADIHAALSTLLAKVCRRLRAKGLSARTLAIKMRMEDRSVRNAQLALQEPCSDELVLAPLLDQLLDKVWRPSEGVRLVGVRTSGFQAPADKPQQEALFQVDDDPSQERAADAVLVDDADKRRDLLQATDTLKDKFGEDAVFFGAALRNRDNATGSISDHPAE